LIPLAANVLVALLDYTYPLDMESAGDSNTDIVAAVAPFGSAAGVAYGAGTDAENTSFLAEGDRYGCHYLRRGGVES
jgi:hypothetical protein